MHTFSAISPQTCTCHSARPVQLHITSPHTRKSHSPPHCMSPLLLPHFTFSFATSHTLSHNISHFFQPHIILSPSTPHIPIYILSHVQQNLQAWPSLHGPDTITQTVEPSTTWLTLNPPCCSWPMDAHASLLASVYMQELSTITPMLC